MNTRPLMAGFAKLCPESPPKALDDDYREDRANDAARRGTLELRFSPSRSPVTTALKSPTAAFCGSQDQTALRKRQRR